MKKNAPNQLTEKIEDSEMALLLTELAAQRGGLYQAAHASYAEAA